MGKHSYIYDKIKTPIMRRRILNESKDKPSIEDFLKFLLEVQTERYFKGSMWGIKNRNETSQLSFGAFKDRLTKQIRDAEKKGSPITHYWISNIRGGLRGQLKLDIEKAMEGGLKGILELGKDYRDNEEKKDIVIGPILTSFTSKDQEKFDDSMGKGEGGRLDESEETSDVSLADLGQDLADEMKSILSKKKELEESDVLATVETVLATVLASTTFINIISKWVGLFMKKRNFKKGAKGAQKIYDFTHKLESLFKLPIKKVVGVFTDDPKVIKIVTDSLYALLILTLGVRAGGEALEAASLKNAGAGAVKGLKAALKGKDLATLVKDIASAAKSVV
tara:strand:+ start:6152 stop:7159 length:1008 start_codon:yes stop_codon:yes gene_type:complete